MDRVSRPLIALLVVTVLFFALWMTMIKSSLNGGGSASSSNSSAGLNADISAAHNAVNLANRAAAAHGGESAAASTSGNASAASSRPAAGARAPLATAAHATGAGRAASRTSVPGALSAGARRSTVLRALAHHRVVALLFYNPSGADDRAVRGELAAVPGHGGQVVKLAVPLSELSRYSMITQTVSVNGSPTLVLIDRARQASTILGFADRFEIAQRVDDALAAR